jgi:DNA mismatch repair protein MSH4
MSRFKETADRSIRGTRGASRSTLATAAQRVPDRVLCSLFESGKLDVSVGVCIINFGTGEIRLSTIADTQTYVRTFHKLHVHEPDEIVMPRNYFSPVQNKLAAILNSNISQDIKVTSLDKRYFKPGSGFHDAKRLCFERDWNFLEKELKDQHLALCALSGAVQHMQNSRSSLGYEKFRVKYETSENVMFIDTGTIRGLQLVQNSIDRKGMSLMKQMNSCVTKMGERILRNSLLQPLTDKPSIEERLKAVTELRESVELTSSIRNELKNCQDLDKLFTLLLLSRDHPSVSDSSQKINDIILVKNAISVTKKISVLLDGSSSSLLKQIQEICSHETIIQVQELIDDSINEDCTWASDTLDLKNQRCYAVRSGRNGLLDVSRQVYKLVLDEVMSIIDRLAEEHGCELEQAFNVRRGFHFRVLDHKSLEAIPDEFVNRKEKRKYIECTTLDIIKCNARLNDTENEILTISNQVVESVIQEITSFLPILFMITEALGLLDLLQCFAYNSIRHNYCCPEFSDSLTLKASRHPVIETLVSPFIANDVCCISDVSRFQVITGMNMSGKSVYLRQVALLSVMAQIGSYVPAEFARLKIFECLRSRICVDSDDSNASTFAAEMNEMVCILEQVNERSLVIIDELGRGSSINDAFAVSLAICEHLINTKATVFITTHFHELSTILSTKSGVVQNHMKTEMVDEQGSVKMKYKLTGGVIESKRYGLRAARNFFPSDVIVRAHEISQKLEGFSNLREEDEAQIRKNKRYMNLVSVLEYVLKSPDFSQQLLIDIQNEFLNQ